MSAESIKDLANAAAQFEDQTETPENDFEYVLPVEGPAVARFIGYIELGKHKQPDFQGQKKPDADEVRLTFELLGKKHVVTDDDGKQRANQISFNISKKLGDKASFKKLFNKMTYGRDIKHMAQMLGEGFLVTVHHNKSKKDEKKVYANLRNKEGEWSVGEPAQYNHIEGTKTMLPVPEQISPSRIFIWNTPTKATWDTLFIDGEREVKEGDTVRKVSKNWLQELILSASNYKCSPLEAMLHKVDDLTLDTSTSQKSSDPVSDTVKEAADTKASSANTETEKNTASATTASPSSAEDDLAALGL